MDDREIQEILNDKDLIATPIRLMSIRKPQGNYGSLLARAFMLLI